MYNLINNIFELSQVCTGVLQNGVTITNFVSIPTQARVENLFRILAFLLLLPAFFEFAFVDRKNRGPFSFALCFATILIPLFLFGDLPSYKYYLVPFYALALTTDYTTLAVAASFPILALFSPYALITALMPLVEIQFLLITWLLRRPSQDSTATTIVSRHSTQKNDDASSQEK